MPRSEFCITLDDRSVIRVSNLFEMSRQIRLLILDGQYELELGKAYPQPAVREMETDLDRFIKRSELIRN